MGKELRIAQRNEYRAVQAVLNIVLAPHTVLEFDYNTNGDRASILVIRSMLDILIDFLSIRPKVPESCGPKRNAVR